MATLNRVAILVDQSPTILVDRSPTIVILSAAKNPRILHFVF
jgi:hypothetical protein